MKLSKFIIVAFGILFAISLHGCGDSEEDEKKKKAAAEKKLKDAKRKRKIKLNMESVAADVKEKFQQKALELIETTKWNETTEHYKKAMNDLQLSDGAKQKMHGQLYATLNKIKKQEVNKADEIKALNKQLQDAVKHSGQSVDGVFNLLQSSLDKIHNAELDKKQQDQVTDWVEQQIKAKSGGLVPEGYGNAVALAAMDQLKGLTRSMAGFVDVDKSTQESLRESTKEFVKGAGSPVADAGNSLVDGLIGAITWGDSTMDATAKSGLGYADTAVDTANGALRTGADTLESTSKAAKQTAKSIVQV
jgi:hypothetical protein